jgi:hypothetical protein
LSFSEERDEARRGKPAAGAKRSPTSNPSPAGSKRRRPPAGPVGDALRHAYVQVVEEDIPPEMIDLLGKLD